jgi:ferric-dicitrate binding protein FerR (iron transport regulator)
MQNNKTISEDIQLLIVDFLQNRIDEKGLILLNNWLQESNEHEKLFNDVKTAWLVSSKNTIQTVSTEKAFIRLKGSRTNADVFKTKPFWNIYRIAASWFVIFMLGSVITGYFTQRYTTKMNQQGYTSVVAPLGSTSYLDLPDGSKVWLNAGSKITYSNDFGNQKRELHLIGEAFFSVKTNRQKPFLVFTSDLVVKALGTKFNVKAYPEEKTITTTLEEGKVVITPIKKSSDKEVIELRPKEVATYYRVKPKEEKVQKANPEKIESAAKETPTSNQFVVNNEIPTELTTSWKEATWIVESEPLDKFAILLERRYNVKIEFDSQELKNYKFTGKIQDENIEQIMKAVELSAPINYTIHRNVISTSLENQRKNRFNEYTND